jgi:hypothetical protein
LNCSGNAASAGDDDGTVANEVTRRIGRQERKVQAPICIKRYNKGMQAVDRHDQLRQTFSLLPVDMVSKVLRQNYSWLVDMALVNGSTSIGE